MLNPDSDWNLPDINELLPQVPLPGDVDSYSSATNNLPAGVHELFSQVRLPVPG